MSDTDSSEEEEEDEIHIVNGKKKLGTVRMAPKPKPVTKPTYRNSRTIKREQSYSWMNN